MLTININISILGAATELTDKTEVTFTMETTGQTVVAGNVVETQAVVAANEVEPMDIDQPPVVYNFPEFIPVSMDIEFDDVHAMQIFPVQMEIDHSLKFNQNTLIRSTSCTI